jgi:2-methylcitrate dehydratase PrpD
MSMRAPGAAQAAVRVTLRDGRTLSRTTDVVHGDAANPRSREELVGKFTALASDTLGPARVREVVDCVAGLESLKDVRDLTALLRP